MSTKFFTNDSENTLINKFEGVLTANESIKCFDALVGYFRASGYFRIRPFLEKVPNIRILVGINVDRLLADAHKAGLEFFKNHDKTKEEFIREIQKDIEKANYDKVTEKGILQFIDDLTGDKPKIEVRAHPEKKIHAKVYIMRPENFTQHTYASAITGSSNLTDSGLGGGNTYNYEFNVQLSDYDDVKFATDEFEKLWAEGVNILPVDVQPIINNTYLNTNITPFELYIKLLIEFFGRNVDYDPDSIGDLPPNFKKLSYQIDAVNEGFYMLQKHNGFILADVVGLGKTVIAAMVAKKFLIENGRDYTRILVVYPPAVEKNWKNTFKYFGIDQYTKFITSHSLDKILDGHQDYWNKEEYDLVLVDESHKFRNHTTGIFQNLQLICRSPRINKGMIDGLQKKVILISATPLNNRPDDIFYQIQMFQDARQSTLPVTNLTSFFAPLIDEYKRLKRFDVLDVARLRHIYGEIRKNVIEPITVRRTRTDLQKIEAYKADLDKQGIKFPDVHPPQKLEYKMDDKLNDLFATTVEYLTAENKLGYYRYQAIAGLQEFIPSLEGRARKELFAEAETVSKSLAFIMKTQLVKRLESSFYAFKSSLLSFKKATDRMLTMFENNRVYIAPDTDINKLLDKGWSEEEIEKEIERLSEENPKNNIFTAADFTSTFVEGLKKDAELLQELVTEWMSIDQDPKLDVFLDGMQKFFLAKKTNLEGKLVVFSESKDTVDYLQEALEAAGRKDVLVISGENRNKMYETIVSNFDANWPDEKQKNQYNIILTTEVLAEGVNLHRSNVIVHYDTPWNSTKLMQRIGRVNRIGTKASDVYNYVFYPSAQGNAQIKLTRTAFMKIQAFHTAFGEDNQVYSTNEILDEVKLHSHAAIKEEEDERLRYLHFLRNFKKKNQDWFAKIKQIPLKSRVGRDAALASKSGCQGGTAAFLKTNKKFEFYWVNKLNESKEITPIEAFKIFEANEDEKNVELIDAHHEHVQLAVDHFEKLEQIQLQTETTPEALGGVAQTAKNYLTVLVTRTKDHLTEKQRQNCIKIITLIDIGRYTNLPTEISKLAKRKPNLKDVAAELDKIAEKYNVDLSAAEKVKKSKVEKPVLIISESFA